MDSPAAGEVIHCGPIEVRFRLEAAQTAGSLTPRGHVHQFTNLETQDARELSVITPGLLGPEYFREIAEVVNLGGPPDVERIMEVMRRHGLRPALPAT